MTAGEGEGEQHRGERRGSADVEEDLAARYARGVRVRTSRAAELTSTLAAAGASITPEPDGALTVSGPDTAAIAELAAARGILLHELVSRRPLWRKRTHSSQLAAGTTTLGQRTGGSGDDGAAAL